MKKDQFEEGRIRTLRERRMRIAEERENAIKRAKVGDAVVSRINAALGTEFSLDDFETDAKLPIEFDGQPNMSDCSGLVAAHTNELRTREIVSCCDAILAPMKGMIGFDEYAFIGTIRTTQTKLMALLELAKSIHDSVLFCPDNYDSIILVDHYKVSGIQRDVDFSLVVQGADLETALATCFENVIHVMGSD